MKLKKNIKLASPSGTKDLIKIKNLINNQTQFVYIRFSDGEMEIIRNQFFQIDNEIITFRNNKSKHNYPLYDRKRFDPKVDQLLRSDLLSSAIYRAEHYFKGVPSSHNGAISDRNLMMRLNGGFSASLTFSDLFLNGNFNYYRKEIVPLFNKYETVVVIGNFRMKPNLYMKNWRHITIPDNVFDSYSEIKKITLDAVLELPKGSLVLSSASSLSNIVGYELIKYRNDITFIDIGTSMHDLMGLEVGIRGYHIEIEKWKLNNVLKKISYKNTREYKLKW